MTAAENTEENTVQVNDFVCFERIGADREWKNTLGKVLSFPTSSHVRVEIYDRAETAPRSNARMDEKLQELATRNGQLQLWEEKQQLEQELQQLEAEEDKASASLFKVREATLQRQSEANTHTRAAMEALDETRQAIERVPQRQWRDMRAPGRPGEELVSLARAIMLALREDRATSWEAMQGVMRQPDFMSRVMQLDCTVTPLPKAYRKKILEEIESGRRHDSLRSRSTQTQTQRGSSTAQGMQIELAMRNWLMAQIACSKAREAEERVVDDCVLENQEQALLVREVNGLREKVSMLEEQIMEKKQAICGNTALATLLLGDGQATTDSLFYRRMNKGRPVTEIILRESVLVVYGEKTEEEDDEGNFFVRLSTKEVDQLREAVRAAKEVHDENELEALYAAEAFEEQQIRELKQRMEELRMKENFTEEDEEEMRQLDALLQAATRRLETTQWRIRQLQALGRDKLHEANKALIGDIVESDLHLKFSGDRWGELLKSREHIENMQNALARDLSRALGLPIANFRNYRFSLGSLMVDFTVRHSTDVTKDQLQSLANDAEFSEFCGYYEKVTFKLTFPLNTAAQETAFEKARFEELFLLNFTGAGVPQKVEEFEDDFADEGASDDEDYHRPHVQIATMRNECGFEALYGYPLYTVLEVPMEVQKAEMALREANVVETAPTPMEEEREAEEEELQPVEGAPAAVEDSIVNENENTAEAENVAEHIDKEDHNEEKKEEAENDANALNMDAEELPYEGEENARKDDGADEL
ncbi:hypothetical protein LSM04_002334 [Trypanosoma melophagium]|uniref:uncharacterized protein n=1 Tax=Trypanosoma melophagium TaxID=715481 RepID=UPI00351A9EE0|nr:hypothetical protein LSM04_002334 [Trypanosoma melophagium]